MTVDRAGAIAALTLLITQLVGLAVSSALLALLTPLVLVVVVGSWASRTRRLAGVSDGLRLRASAAVSASTQGLRYLVAIGWRRRRQGPGHAAGRPSLDASAPSPRPTRR